VWKESTGDLNLRSKKENETRGNECMAIFFPHLILFFENKYNNLNFQEYG
jgi:hypothetical protein